VTSLAVTADSGTLVTGSNNQIKLWDLATLTSNTIRFGSPLNTPAAASTITCYLITITAMSRRAVTALALAADDSLISTK